MIKKIKARDILGMNARSFNLIYPSNPKTKMKLVDNKLATKKLLIRSHLPTPKLYKVFKSLRDLNDFDWMSLSPSFVIKPNMGFGGEGVLVVYGKKKNCWVGVDQRELYLEDLIMHIVDILDGNYSMANIPDTAFIEQKVKIHRAFRKYTYRGTPDIRVIVFNKVPIMSMLRLPTRESGGRANLHQGACGVGIAIDSGITTTAYYRGKQIKYLPGTKIKLNGMQIPFWDQILHLASESQIVSELGYVGVDIVLEREEGPMILELNARPGLGIQLANMAPLQKRLRRVEDLEIDSAEKGVRVAKELYEAGFEKKKDINTGKIILGILEPVKLKHQGHEKLILAKIDTGAFRTTVEKEIVDELDLWPKKVEEKKVRGALGHDVRPIIPLRFYIQGKKIDTEVFVVDRKHMKREMIIGRRDIKDFIIDPSKNVKAQKIQLAEEEEEEEEK